MRDFFRDVDVEAHGMGVTFRALSRRAVQLFLRNFSTEEYVVFDREHEETLYRFLSAEGLAIHREVRSEHR